MLSFNDHVITRNNRISVKKEEGAAKNIRNWKLVIDNVKKTDEGKYMCQLNTEVTNAKTAFLEVTSK